MFRLVDPTGFDRSKPCVLFTKHGPALKGEPNFYSHLRQELHGAGLELLILCFDPAAINQLEGPRFFVPHVPTFRGLDEAQGQTENEAGESPLVGEVVRRFRQWHGMTANAPSGAAISFWHRTLADFIAQLKPAIAVLWNGHHCTDLLLRKALARQHCRIAFVERGFVPGFLHFDENAILADSSLGRSSAVGPEYQEEDYTARTAALTAASTWYAQPPWGDLARRLSAERRGRKVIFFAGQVSGDTQAFLFSPRFRTPREGFAWLLKHLPSDQYFIVGKHHPRAVESPSDYQSLLEKGHGLWTTSYPVSECLAACDRFATVNSTTAYEALLAGKIPLLLGRSLLDHKRIAYQGADVDASDVAAWIRQDDRAERLQRWRRFFSHALADHFTPIDSSGAVAAAHWISARATPTGLPGATILEPTSPVSLAARVVAFEQRAEKINADAIGAERFRLVRYTHAFTHRFPRLAVALRRILPK